MFHFFVRQIDESIYHVLNDFPRFVPVKLHKFVHLAVQRPRDVDRVSGRCVVGLELHRVPLLVVHMGAEASQAQYFLLVILNEILR